MTLTRRNLLAGDIAAHEPAPLPPWAVAMEACTGCGRCAETCPAAVLAMHQGLPRIDFSMGECTFCGLCAEACPEPVFDLAGPAFRHTIEIGATCLSQQGVTCQSCADICPETAIRFRPRIGGPALPALDAASCTGCGACVSVCPVEAISAIIRESADA